MSLNAIFSVAGLLAMSGWLALIALPRLRVARLYATMIVPLLLAIAYAGLMAVYFARSNGGFGDLDAVARLFESRGLLLAGWLHYLAFDLFIGAWQVRTAEREGIRHWFVIPCLILTFLFGPVGLLLFSTLSLIARQRHLASRADHRLDAAAMGVVA